jgi:hypothetical protein
MTLFTMALLPCGLRDPQASFVPIALAGGPARREFAARRIEP